MTNMNNYRLRRSATNLCVAILTGNERHNWIHPHLLNACLRMPVWQHETGSQLTVTTVHGKTPVDSARNVAVQTMLKTNAEWLLQIDNDVAPPMNVLAILENIGNRKVVGLPCPIEYQGLPGMPNGFSLNIGTHRENDTNEMHLSTAPGWSEVDIVGTGCFLVHRDVFAALKEPWFECSQKSGYVGGEDFGFCDKARSAGFSVWTHGSFPCRHYKTVDLGECLRATTQVFKP
jgi:hypothetical protein